MDRRLTIEYLKSLEGIAFIEDIDALPEDCDDARLFYYLHPKIGLIFDNNNTYKVAYLEDNVGEYISLSFMYESNSEQTVKYVLSKIIQGRCHLSENGGIIMVTTFPIIDETIISKQLWQSIKEIREMISLCKNAPE